MDRLQRKEAMECWQEATRRDPEGLPTAHRNLGLALVNVAKDDNAGWRSLEKAFVLDPSDARVLFELDQLAKRRKESPASRLERLQTFPALVS